MNRFLKYRFLSIGLKILTDPLYYKQRIFINLLTDGNNLSVMELLCSAPPMILFRGVCDTSENLLYKKHDEKQVLVETSGSLSLLIILL